LGSECPQLEQVYSVFVATPRLYWIAAKVQQTRGQYRLDGQRIILSYIDLTREVWMMQTRRTLRKVGGSVMLPIPPEMLEELRLGAGQDVEVSSGGNMIRVEPSAPRPSLDAVEFMARFTQKYDEAMRNLARR
jgi:antitoxin component of MazEF toxin-antitoxin module